MYITHPELVKVGGNEKGRPWRIKYNKMTPYLVKAIQEQQEIIDGLLKRIEKLEGK